MSLRVKAKKSPVRDDQHRHVSANLVRVERGLRVHKVGTNAFGPDCGAQYVGDQRRVVACRGDGLLEGALHGRYCFTRHPARGQAVAT